MCGKLKRRFCWKRASAAGVGRVQVTRAGQLADPHPALVARDGAVVVGVGEDGERWWLGLRQSIRDRLHEWGDDYPATGIIAALVTGDRDAIGPRQWQLFAATGTNHLFVISGLHIGLISLCAYMLLLNLCRLVPSMGMYIPLQKIAWSGALLAAICYALLAGFTLPTQRAAVMCGVFILALLLNRHLSVSLRYLLALALALTLNPLAVMNMGFWFSFLAVGALLLVYQDGSASRVKRWLKPQLAVFLLLVPALIYFTGQFSPWAPLVNLVAIPLVGLVIVPLCLITVAGLFLWADLGEVLLTATDFLIIHSLEVLGWVADHGGAVSITTGSSPWPPLFAGLAALLWLLPMTARLRLLSIPLCLPLLLPRHTPGPEPGQFHGHILDVGQGLAVVIQTHKHTLLYDTGAWYHEEFDLGEAVVVPVLRSLGSKLLDGVVISHWDNDHAGGLESVLASFPVARRYAPDTELPGWQHCGARSWQWDGVEFQFLRGNQPGEGNNSSCVLRISTESYSLLLPGDIERAVERQLAVNHPETLHSDVMLAPHHGSNTSSSWPFIKKVDPQWVIYSAGFGNAFGHPATVVQERFKQLGAGALTTHATGMITLQPDPASGAPQFTRYRDRHPRYWH